MSLQSLLPPGSVRLRLTLWNVGVLALLLIVLGPIFYFRLKADSIAALDHHLADMAHGMQRRLPPGPPFSLRPWMRIAPPSLSKGAPSSPPQDDPETPSHPRPRLLDLQGHSLFPGMQITAWDVRTAARAAQGEERFSNITWQHASLRVFSMPLLRDGQVIGVIQTAGPLAPIYTQLNQMTRTLLTLIPLALLIAAVGGAFLTERALRPVRQITQSASQIEAQSLSGRLPVTGRDEFSHLAATFNGMLARLEQAFGQLEQAYQQQQRFTADASHELRTPLTIIKANTSLALAGERTPAQYRQALTATDKAADRMNRIVQDLLLLARSDVGQWKPTLVPTPLADVLTQAVEPLLRPDYPRIVLDLPDPALAVQGDAASLVRLFANLAENAVRHTPVEGQITVTAMGRENIVMVDVVDTGEGITPEHLPHVTERFYRVEESRSRTDGGTGLGLAISMSIVQAHQGTLTLESVVGQGTTVHVTLPRAVRNPVLEPTATPAAQPVPLPV